jgi:hypothetical protein
MIENTGLLWRRRDHAFLGSCVVFRYHTTVLTAGHCVKDCAPGDLLVQFPGSRAGGQLFGAREIVQHATADVAVLTIDTPRDRDLTWAQTDLWSDVAYGVEISAFGYPNTAFGLHEAAEPTPRLFRGIVQRFFERRSPFGYVYTAAELSFGCPSGLSGGPVFNSQFNGRLYGIVTENMEVGTDLASLSEVDDAGQTFTERTRNVINYGVGLWLFPLKSWIDQIVPPPSEDEINLRAVRQHQWTEDERSGEQ